MSWLQFAHLSKKQFLNDYNDDYFERIIILIMPCMFLYINFDSIGNVYYHSNHRCVRVCVRACVRTLREVIRPPAECYCFSGRWRLWATERAPSDVAAIDNASLGLNVKLYTYKTGRG